jgi:hypothetical protein
MGIDAGRRSGRDPFAEVEVSPYLPVLSSAVPTRTRTTESIFSFFVSLPRLLFSPPQAPLSGDYSFLVSVCPLNLPSQLE